MDRQYEQYIKTAKKRAKEYLRLKRGFKTPEEKKAFKIAEKLRIQAWKAGLEALPADERAAQLRAFSTYRGRVYLKLRLIALGLLMLAVLVSALIILL